MIPQNQMSNITQFAVTMLSMAFMSSIFGGMTGGVNMLPYSTDEWSITRSELKRRSIARTGEVWPDYMYSELMGILSRRLDKEVDETIDFYSATVISGTEQEPEPKPVLRRLKKSEW